MSDVLFHPPSQLMDFSEILYKSTLEFDMQV